MWAKQIHMQWFNSSTLLRGLTHKASLLFLFISQLLVTRFWKAGVHHFDSSQIRVESDSNAADPLTTFQFLTSDISLSKSSYVAYVSL